MECVWSGGLTYHVANGNAESPQVVLDIHERVTMATQHYMGTTRTQRRMLTTSPALSRILTSAQTCFY